MTGLVYDAEFGVTRDAFGEACEKFALKLARYKQGEHSAGSWIIP